MCSRKIDYNLRVATKWHYKYFLVYNKNIWFDYYDDELKIGDVR